MGTEITENIVATTEMAGEYKFQILTATLAGTSGSDTILLTAAANKISTIVFADAHLTAGLDGECTYIETSFSSLTIAIKTFAANGTANSSGGAETVEVLVIGK